MKDIHLLDLFQEHQSSGGRDIHVLCEAEANGTPPLKVASASKEQSQLNQVLWLGNSYTFYNDLPVIVARLAAAQGKSILYSNHTEVILMCQHSKTLLFLEQLDLEDARRVAADNGADSESSLGCCCLARAKSQACLSCSNSLRRFHKASCLTCCRHQGQQPWHHPSGEHILKRTLPSFSCLSFISHGGDLLALQRTVQPIQSFATFPLCR